MQLITDYKYSLMNVGQRSIPATSVRPLLKAIKNDFQLREGIGWDGKSSSLKAFFERNSIDPCVNYEEYYKNERHSIAVSYVWSVTSLEVIAEVCELPHYQEESFFVDVLLVFQQGLTSQQVARSIRDYYGNSKMLLFFDQSYFTRAWCCLEIAISTLLGCEQIVLGSCRQIVGMDFFNEMISTVAADKVIIQEQIRSLFKLPAKAKDGCTDNLIRSDDPSENFNRVVSNAMVSLCVTSSKCFPCQLFGNVPRHERSEWKPMLVREHLPVRARDCNRDWEILIGRPASDATLALESRSIRTFLSSTVTDAVVERNFIASDVEPFLQLCAQGYGLDFMFSDMRKGTSEDLDALPPSTMLTELRHCQQVSAGLNYVMIIGNKYGSLPLPDHIPQQEFDQLVNSFEQEEAKQVANDWYELDENVIGSNGLPTPQYVMKAVHNCRDFRGNRGLLQTAFRKAAHREWSEDDVMELRKRTKVVASVRDDRIKSYFVSSLELEAGKGILESDGLSQGKRIQIFQRQFIHGNPELLKSPAIGAFFDMPSGSLGAHAAQKMRELQEDVIASALVARDCHTKYRPVRLLTIGVDPEDDEHAAYLRTFLDDLTRVGIATIKDAARILAVKQQPLVDEIKHHLKFGEDRANRFHSIKSSSDALNQVNQYLAGPGGRAFVLWGPAGGGKTYVMAKAAHERSKIETTMPRFLGTSAKSSDVFNVLENVCANLCIISHGEAAFKNRKKGDGLSSCPTNFDQLRAYFTDVLAEWNYGPITIFLDSVDQLDSSLSGLSLAWLPVLGLSEQVHLVISTCPDDPNPDIGVPHRCLSTLCKKLVPSFNAQLGESEGDATEIVCKEHPHLFVGVEPLMDAAPLLSHLLKQVGRRASKRQADAVSDLVKGSDRAQTPLAVTILADVVAKLHSFDELPKFTVQGVNTKVSVRHFIVTFFLQLQRDHGKNLVSHSLSYLTIPEQGVTESELMDILSIDDPVIAEAYPWWVTHKRRMPSAPVTLLLSALRPFLSRREHRNGGELLSWYHRQFSEAVENHFLSVKISNTAEFVLARLQTLREFFVGRWAKMPKTLGPELFAYVKHFNIGERTAVRSVRDQPLQLSNKGKWHASAEYNARRCVELIPILITEVKCRLFGEQPKTPENYTMLLKTLKVAEQEVCSVDGVVARSMIGVTFKFLSQCSDVVAMVSEAVQMPEVQEVLNTHAIDSECITHFYRWIRKDAPDFKSPAQIIASLLRQPATSKARSTYLSNKVTVEGIPCAVLGNLSNFDAVLAILKGHTSSVNSVCWSPGNGDSIASCSGDGTIIVWDARSGDRISTLEGHSESVQCVAWNFDGDRMASGSADSTIIIWDAKTEFRISTLKGHSREVLCVAWSPSGVQIASGSCDKTIIIWDAKSGDQAWLLKGHTNDVNSVAWSPDADRIVSGSRDKTIVIWDSRTGELLLTLKGHSNWVQGVAWCPKVDKIASGSADKTIIIWNARTGDRVLTMQGHTDYVRSIAWSPQSDRIASGSDDKTIIVWDAKTGARVSTFTGHSSYVQCVAWGANGDQIVSGCGNPFLGGGQNEAIIWDAKTGGKVPTFTGHSAVVTSVGWSPSSCQIASGSEDRSIIIWDAETGEQISTLKGHSNWVQSVSWSPSGDQIASGSADNTIIIWDAKTGNQVSTIKGQWKWANSVVWSAGGDRIVSAYGNPYLGGGLNEVIVWDTKTGCEVSTLKGHSAAVMSVSWSPRSDRIASGSCDKTIIIWDAGTGAQMSTLIGHSNHVQCVAWSPNGKQIASGSADHTVIIWDPTTNEQVTILRGHGGTIFSVVWCPNPDRCQVLTGSADKTVILWDCLTGKAVSMLKGHTGEVNGVAWSPSRQKVASVSDDGTVIIWDAHTATLGSDPIDQSDIVLSDVLSGLGERTISDSRDKAVAVWNSKTGRQRLKDDVKPDSLIASSSGRAVRASDGQPVIVQGVAPQGAAAQGDKIVSASPDQRLFVLDAKSGNQVLTTQGQIGDSTTTALGPAVARGAEPREASSGPQQAGGRTVSDGGSNIAMDAGSAIEGGTTPRAAGEADNVAPTEASVAQAPAESDARGDAESVKCACCRTQ